MPDLRNMENFGRFQRAFRWSRRELQVYRTRRTDTIKQFVGGKYSTGGSSKAVPVNFLWLAITIYQRLIAARAPKTLVSTPFKELKASGKRLELALDHLIDEINFDETLEDWVTDALFGPGIIKVGITTEDLAEEEGFTHDAGQFFADVVDLDDWVVDMTARRYEQVQYAGNRWSIRADALLESDDYRVTRREIESTGSKFRMMNEDGDTRSSLIGSNTGITGQHEETQMEETVELWDIWAPRDNEIWTFLASSEGGIAGERPIRKTEWIGPEAGPYMLLEFQRVPNQVMPLPQTAILRDIHDLANTIFRKLQNQSERQKTITGVRGNSMADGKRTIEADDGDMIRLDDPNAVREFKMGGIDNMNLAFFLQVRDLFYDLGGNLDALGGLSPQSRTLGQDELINSNASQQIAAAQEKTVSRTTDVLEAAANYLWLHPSIDIPLVRPIEGTNLSIPTRFAPEVREGDFIQYNIQIHPYSMVHSTPTTKMQSMITLMDRLVAPYLPLMQAQGMSINFHELFDLAAEFLDLPEFRNILQIVGTPELLGGPVGGSARGVQSPNTTRTNVRVNRPGATRRGSDTALSAILSGGNVQPSESAAIGRPNA